MHDSHQGTRLRLSEDDRREVVGRPPAGSQEAARPPFGGRPPAAAAAERWVAPALCLVAAALTWTVFHEPPAVAPPPTTHSPLAVHAAPAVERPRGSERATRAQQASAAQPAAALVRLAVRTQPPGAALFVDGAARGKSPLELELPPGSNVTVVARAPGHAPARQQIAVPQDGDGAAVELVLAPLQQVATTHGDDPAASKGDSERPRTTRREASAFADEQQEPARSPFDEPGASPARAPFVSAGGGAPLAPPREAERGPSADQAAPPSAVPDDPPDTGSDGE